MRVENGVAYLEGDLTLAQVVPVMKEGEHLLADGVAAFDLSGLGQVDSAALSLLMNWCRTAHTQGRSLDFRNTPESLHSLAKLYGVADLIKLS
ncbi:MAG TPA: STAS domain-containing protein [Parasulfuritortus sp.]